MSYRLTKASLLFCFLAIASWLSATATAGAQPLTTRPALNMLTANCAATNLLIGGATSPGCGPTPTRAGDLLYFNGTAYVSLAGNNSGTQLLQETSAGVPSWVTVSGTGTLTTLTAGTGISFSSGSTCTTACTVNGALPEPQGRLTLQANTPVMATSQTAQATLRYDAYLGNQVPYYTGSLDAIDTIASNEVTDAMVSAASAGQVVSGQVYDVWWVHGGANRICLAMSASTGGGGGWASDTGGSNTARGTGYSQLDRVTRPYVTNKNSITNCFNAATNYGPVSANQGTYLGAVSASANGQISYTFGGAASGGTAGLFGVWNMYNRVTTNTIVTDNGSAYTYTSSTTRQARGSPGNQVGFVSGIAEDGVTASYGGQILTVAASGAFGIFGVGLDSPTNFACQSVVVAAAGAAANNIAGTATCALAAQVGLHTVFANEHSDGTNANTFDPGTTNTLSVSIRN
jgi:hypothetical protein